MIPEYHIREITSAGPEAFIVEIEFEESFEMDGKQYREGDRYKQGFGKGDGWLKEDGDGTPKFVKHLNKKFDRLTEKEEPSVESIKNKYRGMQINNKGRSKTPK